MKTWQSQAFIKLWANRSVKTCAAHRRITYTALPLLGFSLRFIPTGTPEA